jgi:hypothetical protein
MMGVYQAYGLEHLLCNKLNKNNDLDENKYASKFEWIDDIILYDKSVTIVTVINKVFKLLLSLIYFQMEVSIRISIKTLNQYLYLFQKGNCV